MSIEKLISFHIEKQFPAIYREEGQELVQFVKEYYRFLETNTEQSLYNGRRIYEYRDIDTTLERMLLFFKRKYLADLPFDDETVRIVVKNILGLYRRKGTQAGLELFFRLFYNQDIKVYYPARDILRPSDSEWNNGIYLEILPNNGIFTSTKTDRVFTYKDMIARNIVGEASGARAIADRINFIIINNTILPIIFVNEVTSNFIKLENIICEIDGISVNFGTVKGSLNEIQVDTNAKEASLNNEVGDIVVFETSQGIGGEGLVTSVTETFSGFVNYTVEDGGWGYSIDTTRLLVSNQIIFLSEEQTASRPFELIPGENVRDQIGNSGRMIGKGEFGIGLKAAANNEFAANSEIFSVDRDPLNSFVLVNSDIFDVPSPVAPYSLAEAILRATVNIEPEKTRFDAIVSGSRKLGDLDNDGSVTENDALQLLNYLAGVQTNQSIIDYVEGDFKTYLENNSATYKDYSAFKYKYVSVVAKNDTSPGDLRPDTGDPNDVVVSSLANIETVSLIFDVIGDYTSVQLNSANYNDSPAAQPMSGNTDPVTINTSLSDAFNLSPFQIGTIVRFDNINPGTEYVNDVYSIAEDSRIVSFERHNQIITLANIPGTLNIGDEVSQNGIKGKVLRIQDRTIILRPYTYYGFNNVDPISYGGQNLDIEAVSINFGDDVLGKNATINSATDFGIGKIREIRIIDSGYAYTDREPININILNKDTLIKVGEGIISLGGQGTTGGFWSTLDSHLNGYVKTVAKDGFDEYFEGGKRIHDNNFYQEYSYEIQSAIDISEYETSLKEITHVAGTKVFGRFNLENVIESNVDIKRVTIG